VKRTSPGHFTYDFKICFTSAVQRIWRKEKRRRAGKSLGEGDPNFRPPDMVPRKPVRFLVLLGGLRPRNGSRVEFSETACGFDSGPSREPRELAIDEVNWVGPAWYGADLRWVRDRRHLV